MSWSRRAMKNRNGAVMLLVAASIVALVGFVAISVELGRLYNVKLEIRRATDAATLAALSAVQDISDTASARAAAVLRGDSFFVANRVANRSLPTDDLTVTTISDSNKVRVTVNAKVKTTFGQILGFSNISITSTASARVATAATVSCMRPLIIADGFQNKSGDKAFDTTGSPPDYYGTDSTGLGSAFRNSTGYTKDFGRPDSLRIYSNSDHLIVYPDVFYLVQLPNQAGYNTRDMIEDTRCANNSYSVGQTLSQTNGQQVSFWTNGFQTLINADRNLRWNSSSKTFTGSTYTDWRDSPRILTVALFNPTSSPASGTINIVGFAGIFADTMVGSGNNAYLRIRWTNVRGVAGSCTGTCGKMSGFTQLTQ